MRRDLRAITRRGLLRAAGTVAGGAALGLPGILRAERGPAIVRRRQPNILLIVTDQEQSWQDLPARLELPGRQRLAEQALLFRNYHITFPLCAPSRATMYTGQHVQHNGVWDNTPLPYIGSMDPKIPTLGTMLRDAGYATAYRGKWHLSGIRDEDRETTRQELRTYGFEDSDQEGEIDGTLAGYQQDGASAEHASRWIRAHAGGERPWFLAVNFVNPHDIMFFETSPEQSASRVSPGFPGPLAPTPNDSLYQQDLGFELPENFGPESRKGNPAVQERVWNIYQLGMGAIPFERRDLWYGYQNYYYNCLRDVDRRIETVLTALEASGQDDHTVVVLTSDHGEMLGVHGLRGKGCVAYKEASRVPLAIRHPDVANGKRTPALASSLDLVPTLLAFAGLQRDDVAERYPGLRGRDLSTVVSSGNSRGPREESEDGVLIQYTGILWLDDRFAAKIARLGSAEGVFAKLGAFVSEPWIPDFDKRGMMRALFDGRHRFVRYFAPSDHHLPKTLSELTTRNDLELYDTQLDAAENQNLARDPGAYGPLLVHLNDKLNRLIRSEIGPDDGSHMPGLERFWRH